jgi:hypothetical protein
MAPAWNWSSIYYHECCGVIDVLCFHGCAECFKCPECLPKLRAAGSLGIEDDQQDPIEIGGTMQRKRIDLTDHEIEVLKGIFRRIEEANPVTVVRAHDLLSAVEQRLGLPLTKLITRPDPTDHDHVMTDDDEPF